MRDELATTRPALISLERIAKVYRMGEVEVHALRALDLEIGRGELVAIMGASGSGKSTLLNILGTLDRPTGGHYRLDGEPIEGRSEVELSALRNRAMGFVFQQFNLLPRDSALENVELPMIYAGVPRSARRVRARAALERVGLGDRLDHLPTQLSGGQQQRVSIARAIVNEPLLLLADEPTGALDTRSGHEVIELLTELHTETGMTIIIVTHDPNVAATATRRIEMRDGQLLSESEAERVDAQ
jgi:putative ABC transport system ATP-binding protein